MSEGLSRYQQVRQLVIASRALVQALSEEREAGLLRSAQHRALIVLEEKLHPFADVASPVAADEGERPPAAGAARPGGECIPPSPTPAADQAQGAGA